MICRICDSAELVPVLDLGLQPWANHFLKKEEVGSEPAYPLRLVYCLDCACVQLDYTVPKEVMFLDHTYVSGTTKTLAQHFAATAKEVDRSFADGRPHKSVLDIGSNDGTHLKQYQALGFETLGVEPCGRIAAMAQAQGVNTVVDFFNAESARKIGRKFDVINASGVFFHLEELHSAAEGVRLCLADDGVFVIQFLYMKSIVENLAFDQIYHEHLLYYTLQTVNRLLARHGMEGFDGYLSPIHGGSIILFAGHSGRRPRSERLSAMLQAEDEAGTNKIESYQAFAKRVELMKERTLAFLKERKAAGKTIFGFGAPVKGNTFLNYCGIGTQFLECLVEKNPMRKGLYSPGMHIPIALEDELRAPPDMYLVLAWNFKKEILQNNRQLVEQGVEFYFPVNPGEKAAA
jgi:SAM-dependent methyltransferase